jgi:undecaprenyl-diphosphatase
LPFFRVTERKPNEVWAESPTWRESDLNVLVRLREQDERAFLLVTARRFRLLDGLMHGATHAADPGFAIAFAVGLLLGALPGLQHVGAAAAFTLLASHIGVQILKRTVNRPRPDFGADRPLLVPPDRFSFPSGHAAASLSLALALSATVPAPLAVVVLCVAGLTGVSRCYLGVHYPSDVMVGWGLAWVAHWLAEPALHWLGRL